MAMSSTKSNSPPDPDEDLRNLLRYAECLHCWTERKSLVDYLADTILNDAVERNFIEIGNIIHRFETTAPHLYQSIPQAQEWYAFRIKLDHIRWTVRPDIVWETTRQDLPVLIQAANRLIQEAQA